MRRPLAYFRSAFRPANIPRPDPASAYVASCEHYEHHRVVTAARRRTFLKSGERASWLVLIFACLEVVFAVTAYWWIAIHFDTQRHLWIKVCVAPLLLLRSQKSVAAGVQKFVRYTESFDPYMRLSPRRQWDNWLLGGFSVVLSATISFWLARHWLADFDGWSLIWRSVILGWIICNIGLAVAAAKGAGGLAQTAPYRKTSLRTVGIVHTVLYPIIERTAPVLGAIIAGITATAAGAPHGFRVYAAILGAIAPVLGAIIAWIIATSAGAPYRFRVYAVILGAIAPVLGAIIAWIITTAPGASLEFGVSATFLGALAPFLFYLLRARLVGGGLDFRNSAHLATLIIGVLLVFGVPVGYLTLEPC